MINRSMQPRQMYGLGSLVKKAVKGVKNIIKSPVGKAAILGVAGFGIPGTSFGGLFGRAGLGGAAKGLLGNFGLAQTLGMTGMSPEAMGGKSPGILSALQRGFGGMSTAAKAFLGGGAALTLSDMFPKKEGEDDDTYAERLKRLEPLMDRYYKNVNPNASAGEVKDFILKNTQEYKAMGGRVGYRFGGDTMEKEGIKSLEAGAPDVTYRGDMRLASESGPEEFEMDLMSELIQAFEEAKKQGFRGDFKSFLDMYMSDSVRAPEGIMQEAPTQMMANGGRIGLMEGATPLEEDDEEDSYRAGVLQAMSRRKVMGGGIMDMPMGEMRINEGGVMERDYRDKGGFVPVGIKEKADDVPAMLSKNEFVMTADAVRGAGNGSIEKGAQRMYDLMKQNERKVV